MQRRQFNELEAARRAYSFLTTAPPVPSLANVPATFTQQVQALGATITQVDGQASAQTAATGTITDRVSAVAEAARELRTGHLAAVKTVAKLLVQGSTGSTLSPNFADSIHVPNVRSHSALLAASAAAVQLVTPYKDLFVARGLPADFLDQLTAQAATLRQAMQDAGTAKTVRASATKDLKQLLQELRSTMHVLELGVAKACRADRLNGPTTMTAWRNARTIRKVATPTDIPFVPPPPTVVTPSSSSTTAPVPVAPSTSAAAAPTSTTTPTSNA